MSDPHLKRPVWLTTEQRHKVKEALVVAIQHPEADIEVCKMILSELIESHHRDLKVTQNVKIIIKGLRMPKDILPIYICDVEAWQIIKYGKLDNDIANILIYKSKRRKK